MIDPQDAALVPRHVPVEALHAAKKAVGRVLERHGIQRDLFGRFELLDLALDEAEAEAEIDKAGVNETYGEVRGSIASGVPPVSLVVTPAYRRKLGHPSGLDDGGTHNPVMGTTDDGLDATSRRLLNEIDELKRLELEKRHTARSSDEFHQLASKVEAAARHVFDSAEQQADEGDQESPIQDERDERHPGDWTEGSLN